ncbi:hypothetical protein Desmu_0001 [Desulfurococcus mucosus DSM 2162]|uniref:Uncharacterized protein n=1 Tax=Desulfurococcus mucosus (strain ATCC 35584 / DSM 2162 / JCM 9187 / O7/1) TaxID=765177 RepID=E8RA42_DESM0|nr:hypothetical protein Desmu_0001 [Desulfurococcus mucosus DSM 2162]
MRGLQPFVNEGLFPSRDNQMGGSLTTPTAPQMTDVNPNKCGEPMNRPKGTPALKGGEEVR